jgi:nucleoside-diphosphate-sugar epimerase
LETALGGARILVTGASGFIGSELTRRLVAERAFVYVLSRRSSSRHRLSDLASDLHFLLGDLSDREFLAQCIEESHPDIVFHLAADTRVRYFDGDLDRLDASIDVNFKGTLNLVTALLRASCPIRCFVRAGGLEEYGDGALPYDEGQREQPISPYSAAQVAATHYCHMLHTTMAFPVVTLRPALVYGPAQSTDFFIPALISHCLSGRDFVLKAPNTSRELLFVGDAVDAFVRAASTPSAIGQVFNLGTGNEYVMRNVAHRIIQLTSASIELQVESTPAAAPAIPRLACKSGKARQVLSWSHQVEIDEGLSRTVAWYKAAQTRKCARYDVRPLVLKAG